MCLPAALEPPPAKQCPEPTIQVERQSSSQQWQPAEPSPGEHAYSVSRMGPSPTSSPVPVPKLQLPADTLQPRPLLPPPSPREQQEQQQHSLHNDLGRLLITPPVSPWDSLEHMVTSTPVDRALLSKRAMGTPPTAVIPSSPWIMSSAVQTGVEVHSLPSNEASARSIPIFYVHMVAEEGGQKYLCMRWRTFRSTHTSAAA